MTGSWTIIPLTNLVPVYGGVLVDNSIFTPSMSRCDVVVPGWVSEPGLFYEFEVTTTPHPDLTPSNNPISVYIYSQLPGGDEATAVLSTWYDLNPDGWNLSSDGPISLRFGSGRYQYNAALTAGETGLLIEFYDRALTGLRYRLVDSFFGPPMSSPRTLLDPDGPFYPDATYPDWGIIQGGSIASVWSGVAVCAWHTDYSHTYSFKARAVRYSEVAQEPACALGPLFIGPDQVTLPQNTAVTPAPAGAESYRDVGYMAGIGGGWVAVIPHEMSYRNPVFAQLIHVDQTTLEITLGSPVVDPTLVRHPGAFNFPPAYGDGRIGVANYYDSSTSSGGGIAWMSWTTGNPAASLRFVPWTMTGLLDAGLNSYACFADMGTYWIGVYFPSDISVIQIHTMPDDGGMPDFGNITGRISHPDTISDFDAIFVMPGADGNALMFSRNKDGGASPMRLIDTTSWTVTDVFSVPATRGIPGNYMLGLDAWSSWTPVTPTTNPAGDITPAEAAFGFSSYIWNSGNAEKSGIFVGLFDADGTRDVIQVYDYVYDSRGGNPASSIRNVESVYIGNGRMMTYAALSDRDTVQSNGSNVPSPPYVIDCPLIFATKLPSFIIEDWRNLVINPSGEQSYNKAWTASNGTVEMVTG